LHKHRVLLTLDAKKFRTTDQLFLVIQLDGSKPVRYGHIEGGYRGVVYSGSDGCDFWRRGVLRQADADVAERHWAPKIWATMDFLTTCFAGFGPQKSD